MRSRGIPNRLGSHEISRDLFLGGGSRDLLITRCRNIYLSKHLVIKRSREISWDPKLFGIPRDLTGSLDHPASGWWWGGGDQEIPDQEIPGGVIKRSRIGWERPQRGIPRDLTGSLDHQVSENYSLGNRPRDPLRSTGRSPDINLQQKSAPGTNSKAIS